MIIVSNGKPRQLIAFRELTEKEQQDFDYIPDGERDTWRLFRYRGNVYDTYEFEAVSRVIGAFPSGEHPFADWDGYQSDSFFSGVLIRWRDEDYDSVVVGRYNT